MRETLEKNNRLVGGLWCTDVLAKLSAYLDGEVNQEEKTAIDTHLAECSNCRVFGLSMGGMVAALGSGAMEQAEDQLVARLLDRFEKQKD